MITIDIPYIELSSRKIAIIHGIAFYQSSGTNTSAAGKGFWFPMAGCMQRQQHDDIPALLTLPPNYSKSTEEVIFKPTRDALLRPYRKQTFIGLWQASTEAGLAACQQQQRADTYPRNNVIFLRHPDDTGNHDELIITKNGDIQGKITLDSDTTINKIRPLLHHTSSSHFRNGYLKLSDTEHAKSLADWVYWIVFQTKTIEKLPITRRFQRENFSSSEFCQRICHERLLAISASLGGVTWDTSEGQATKKILQEKYPYYFDFNITWINQGNHVDSLNVNLWINTRNGYLYDGNLYALLERIQHPQYSKLQTLLKAPICISNTKVAEAVERYVQMLKETPHYLEQLAYLEKCVKDLHPNPQQEIPERALEVLTQYYGEYGNLFASKLHRLQGHDTSCGFYRSNAKTKLAEIALSFLVFHLNAQYQMYDHDQLDLETELYKEINEEESTLRKAMLTPRLWTTSSKTIAGMDITPEQLKTQIQFMKK